MSYDKAIEFFENEKKEREDWYKGRGKVSLYDMAVQDKHTQRCEWAIEMLKSQKFAEKK